MKHISWIVSLLFIAGTAFGQTAGVSVTLTATSPNAEVANVSVVGNQITLTATVRTPGTAVQPVGGGGTTYERDRLRFTFKAQRDWPCPQTITIATNRSADGGSSGSASLITESHIATYWWTPQAVQAGEYTLSVDVTYVSGKSIPTTQTLLKPEAVGSATRSYKVTPPMGFPGNLTFSAYPESGSTVPFPVNVTLSASASIPSDLSPSKWRFKFECWGCNPPTSPPIEVTVPSASWTTSVETPGLHKLFVNVDKVRTSDCFWQYKHSAYNLNWFLNAQ